MSGGNTLTTLLTGAAIVGTGGAALAPTLGLTATTASTLSTIGVVAGSSLAVVGGLQASKGIEFEEKQYKEQIDREKVSASIESEQREKRLRRVLSSQRALFASRGIALGSGVSQTAAQVSTSEATREYRVASLGSGYRMRQSAYGAQQKAIESRTAVTGGLARGAQSLLSLPQLRRDV